MLQQQKDFDPRTCNKCGERADLGMTCVGPRCQRCGCDNARPENEDPNFLFFDLGATAAYYGG